MTRIQYNFDYPLYITSPIFLIGTTQVYVGISLETLQYDIIELDTETVLYSGQCNSLRMCKTNARAKLKQLGVTFNTEARRSNV